MMSRPVKIIFALAFVLFGVFLASWFYQNYSWVKEQKDVGFQGIARTNQLLAAEFFLRKMGVNVQQVNGLTALRDLPSTKHTILITTMRTTINQELSDALLNWVKSGGHVIVQANYFPDYEFDDDMPEQLPDGYDDKLLKNWSIFSTRSNADKDNKDVATSVSLNSLSLNTSINVDFPYQRTLVTSLPRSVEIWRVEDNAAQYLIQFPLEKGLLTVLSSTSIFINGNIADHDHAQFLHFLVQQAGHDAGVWLIRVDDMPSLWQWLWNNAWYAMFCLGVLFFLWLWRAPLRFGPVLNDAQLERRSLLEHIRASGYYRWHNKQSGYLLEQVQNRLWTKIEKMHPAVQRDDQRQAYQMLEAITGVKQSLISDALLKSDNINEHEFTYKIKLLEQIYQHL